MKIKEIKVRSKQSYNFNTYEVGLIVEPNNTEVLSEVIEKLQDMCRKKVEEQIDIDRDKLGGKK